MRWCTVKMFKVNNRNENPLYLKIKCKCDKSDIEKSFPLVECIHCKCQQADDSIPDKAFTINDYTYDKNHKVTSTKKRIVNEITLMNCSKYGSCLGWSF